LGLYNEAIEMYDKIIEIDLNYTDSAINNKGLALHDLGLYNEAIEMYDKVIEMNNNDTYALFDAFR
jgi:tetratricopeptide (TPR) repeat protein